MKSEDIENYVASMFKAKCIRELIDFSKSLVFNINDQFTIYNNGIIIFFLSDENYVSNFIIRKNENIFDFNMYKRENEFDIDNNNISYISYVQNLPFIISEEEYFQLSLIKNISLFSYNFHKKIINFTKVMEAIALNNFINYVEDWDEMI